MCDSLNFDKNQQLKSYRQKRTHYGQVIVNLKV
jgi:hypothetical protein